MIQGGGIYLSALRGDGGASLRGLRGDTGRGRLSEH